MDVDSAETDTALWERMNLEERVKEASKTVRAQIPAVYAFTTSAEANGGVKAQKYSGPQAAPEFVMGIQALLIRNINRP